MVILCHHSHSESLKKQWEPWMKPFWDKGTVTMFLKMCNLSLNRRIGWWNNGISCLYDVLQLVKFYMLKDCKQKLTVWSVKLSVSLSPWALFIGRKHSRVTSVCVQPLNKPNWFLKSWYILYIIIKYFSVITQHAK